MIPTADLRSERHRHTFPEDSYQHITRLVEKYDDAVRSANQRLESSYLCNELCKDDVECKRLLLTTAVVDYLSVYYSRESIVGSGGTVGNRCPKNGHEEKFKNFSEVDGSENERKWERYHSQLEATKYPNWAPNVL